ncbi:GntR family transcriptional regulator [Agrobacterium vitis]|uniref:GntR family transcriptional regulator n=1 Tax=Agrobacterium vitis TaxID=373 RepID=UPI0015DAC3FD|nr:GntR family transcriptional regulator [Agrobacterium vitis]BCH66699.1 GntR family transcriptional regulator [Agrobacterium vitis]
MQKDTKASVKLADTATHGRRAVIELREKIISGHLTGGTRLFEVSLAEELDISRTPVREALSRLAEEGLLDRLPNGGFVVRRFGYDDVIDAIELRGVLEGTAARLAAERGADAEALATISETIVKLDQCFGPYVDDVDFDAYADLNEIFHRQLAALCASEVMRREVERACALPFASPSAFLPNRMDIAAFRRSLRSAQEQHRGLVEAITAREGARAEAIAREHARTARRNLDYLFKEAPGLIDKIPGMALIRR